MSDDSYFDQRYYHVVVMVPGGDWHLSDVWGALGVSGAGRAPDSTNRLTSLQHRTLRAESLVARGEAGPTLFGRDGSYILDVFGLEATMRKKQRVVALGVPYVEVGRRLSLRLRDAGLLKQTEFLKIRLAKLVESVRLQTEAVADLRITRVEARIDDDPEVTGVAIAGEGPVLSRLYDKIWKETAKRAVIKRCIVHYSTDDQGFSVHCDTFGNFRVWIRRGAANVPLLRVGLEIFLSSDTAYTDAAIPYFRAAEIEVEG